MSEHLEGRSGPFQVNTRHSFGDTETNHEKPTAECPAKILISNLRSVTATLLGPIKTNLFRATHEISRLKAPTLTVYISF